MRGIVIRKNTEKIIFENPGYSRTGKQQMRKGGISDPRNKILMKMFNLINIGERAGSGVPNIFNTWADQGWPEPIIEEEFDPDRTILVLTIKNSSSSSNVPYQDKLHYHYILWQSLALIVCHPLLVSLPRIQQSFHLPGDTLAWQGL